MTLKELFNGYQVMKNYLKYWILKMESYLDTQKKTKLISLRGYI